MKDIDKFRQEIKRLRQEIKDEKDPLAPNQKAGYLFALTDMESFLDTLSEEPDKSLKEAAEEYIKKGRYLPEAFLVRPAFIAGAEWQASQMPMPEDTVLFQKGVAEGRRLEREDMLKDAVEGIVTTRSMAGNIVTAHVDYRYKDRQKVRIVVLKEEEE